MAHEEKFYCFTIALKQCTCTCFQKIYMAVSLFFIIIILYIVLLEFKKSMITVFLSVRCVMIDYLVDLCSLIDKEKFLSLVLPMLVNFWRKLLENRKLIFKHKLWFNLREKCQLLWYERLFGIIEVKHLDHLIHSKKILLE